MASILDLLPILTILAVGAGICQLLRKVTQYNFRRSEYFNIFLLLGSFILIFPLTWIGIQPNGVLLFSYGEYSIEIISFRGWCLVYFLVGLLIIIITLYFLLRKILLRLEYFQFDLDIIKDHRIALLGFLLLDYLILELILPLRGFDALYYYFPETEVFFLAGRITEINYLSFLPVSKSPLNVLLYVYSYYVTGNMFFQLIPFLFLLGLVLVIYDFSIELFHEKQLAYIACIFTLCLPLIYWLMNYYAFYQDLYLCYFFSVTCYFALKWYKSPRITLGFFMVIGIIISLLTKITGWILPIILVLWHPTDLKGKIPRLVILILLGTFLCAQAATRIFVGVTIPIIISLGIVAFLIIKENQTAHTKETFIQFIPIGIGITIGSFWLSDRISLSKSVWQEIYNTYFHLSETIKWNYPLQSLNPLFHSLETTHRISIVSAAGILLLGTAFVLPWAILKISALKSFRKISAPLIWILVFFSIWSTYYLEGSIRYLAPIITPMILCTSWGFYQLTRKIDNKAKRDFAGLLFAFFGCLSFYYLKALQSLQSLSIMDQTQESVGFSYNQAALDYYSQPVCLIILAVGISVFIIVIIRQDLVVQLLESLGKRTNITGLSRFFHNLVQLIDSLGKKINIWGVSKLFLIATIIIIPLIVQGYLVFYSKGDLTEFHAIHEYEYRTEYQELVKVIQQQNQPLAAIMTVRTPGLQFFTGQPVIDIYYQQNLFPGDPFFTNTNLTELIEVLRNPINYIIDTDVNFNLTVSLRFIVVPSTQNLYYDVYITQIKIRSFLFQSLDNPQNFTLRYNNSDYLLYEVLF